MERLLFPINGNLNVYSADTWSFEPAVIANTYVSFLGSVEYETNESRLGQRWLEVPESISQSLGSSVIADP